MTPWRHFFLPKVLRGEAREDFCLYLEGRRRREREFHSSRTKQITHAMGNHNPRSKTWLEAHKVGFLRTRNAKHSLNESRVKATPWAMIKLRVRARMGGEALITRGT